MQQRLIEYSALLVEQLGRLKLYTLVGELYIDTSGQHSSLLTTTLFSLVCYIKIVALLTIFDIITARINVTLVFEFD